MKQLLPFWMAGARGPMAVVVRGEPWATNGHCAFAVAPPEGAPVVGQDDMFEGAFQQATDPALGEVRIFNGWRRFARHTRVFREHVMAFAEASFPGIEWRRTPNGIDPLVGFLGSSPRALVMPVDPRDQDDRGGWPVCMDCNGTGGDYCKHCDRGDTCNACEGYGRLVGYVENVCIGDPLTPEQEAELAQDAEDIAAGRARLVAHEDVPAALEEIARGTGS